MAVEFPFGVAEIKKYLAQMQVKCFFCIIFLAFVFACQAYEIKEIPQSSDVASPTRLILVFLPVNYQAYGDFKTDVETLVRRLKETKPFNEFPDAIASWEVDLSPEEAAKFLKPREGFPPIKVESSFLQSAYDKVRVNYKLVILDKTGGSPCAELSSSRATSLIFLGRSQFANNDTFAQVFLHELGHSLGVRDESPHSSQPIVPGPPNCAPDQKTAEAWWGDMVARQVYGVSYYPFENGRNHFLKPTLHSVMEDPYRFDDFGPVNERYLREVLEGSG